jgi:hypothetical protein
MQDKNDILDILKSCQDVFARVERQHQILTEK